MTKFTAEIEYAYQHFMTLVEGTHPRTLSKDHFEHVAGILANAVERAVEAKYNSGERTPWTKDAEAKYVSAPDEAQRQQSVRHGSDSGHALRSIGQNALGKFVVLSNVHSDGSVSGPSWVGIAGITPTIRGV